MDLAGELPLAPTGRRVQYRRKAKNVEAVAQMPITHLRHRLDAAYRDLEMIMRASTAMHPSV